MPPSDVALPDFEDIRAAQRRIAGHVVRTPVLRHPVIDELVGAEVHLKCESMQLGGAFKLRGALNAVLLLSDEDASSGVAAHSSGNHAIAVARAVAVRGIPAQVVMPVDAPRAKRDAVKAAGGSVVECEPGMAARREGLRRVISDTGAHEIPPYDDIRVIAGAGTAALELMEDVPDVELVMAPVSGGGLLSGTAIAVHGMAPSCAVWGAEPAGADDAARSLAAGHRIAPQSVDTIADGLRAELSDRTFAALQRHVRGIVTVTDDEIVDAMRLLFTQVKLVVEASGATGVAGAARLPPPRPQTHRRDRLGRERRPRSASVRLASRRGR